MAAVSLKGDGRRLPPKARAQESDRYLGARMRERRIMLGITQQQMAEFIGVSYQQAHKYEKGTNRVAAGRLFTIAQALGVDVSYFFLGMDSKGSFEPTPQQRMLLELARDFINMPSRGYQKALCDLARTLSNLEMQEGEDGRGHAAAAVLAEAGARSRPSDTWAEPFRR